MRNAAAGVLAVMAAVCGCSTSGGHAVDPSARSYVNRDLGVSFRVPAGWVESAPWLPNTNSVVRFESSGEGAIVLGRGPFAGANCTAAAAAVLKDTTGGIFASQNEFRVSSARGELSAGQGEISAGGRAGEARYFCQGTTAIVLATSVPWQQLNARRAELDGVVDSLSFDAGGGELAVRPAAIATPAQNFFVHLVTFRGQTLGQIAEWYTGSMENWKKLLPVNEDLSAANEPLKVGREVKIPTAIVVRRDPLPEPKRKRAGARTSQKPPAEESKPADPAATAPEEEAPPPAVMGPR
jgi:hypothetical protein